MSENPVVRITAPAAAGGKRKSPALGRGLGALLGETRREAPQVAELSLHAAREFRVMIDHLPDYKNDPVVMEKAISIGNIENEGDDIYHSALYRLFHEDSYDARQSLAWLRLFDRMEMGMDAFDKAAGVVRSVVMKSA